MLTESLAPERSQMGGDISYYSRGIRQTETEPVRDFSTPVDMTGVRSPKRRLITLFYPE